MRAAPAGAARIPDVSPARMLTASSTYHRHGRRPLALAVLAAGVLALPGSARAAELLVSGAGWGHGVGMSQEGALGYAEHGWSYEAILAHYYTGTAIGPAPAGARVRVLIGKRVKSMPLETYVRGVVAAEMPSSWPVAALEAQAVASRTYALTAHAGGSRFDVYADTRSQLYRGPAAYTPQGDAAVAATAGQIVTYGGQPAITYFFASSGGRTEDVENAFLGALPEPWLRSVDDPFDQGPLHGWRIAISFHSATLRLRGRLRGAFRGIEVLRRGSSPRILAAAVLGSRGRTTISGAELAARLGLFDTWAYFSVARGPGTAPSTTLGPTTAPATTAPAPASSGSLKVAGSGGSEGPAGSSQGALGGTAAPG
ncbi:MAG: SpoIID/LytB domain-containing protein [Actinobacteria bacterium]|nr:MAG: SpoIID/LytB domain-containing protein [Actinomycetota bacterium]